MAKEGARVVLGDINITGAEGVASESRSAEGEAIALETDIADEPAVKAMVAEAVRGYGGVDVLANVAADFHPARRSVPGDDAASSPGTVARAIGGPREHDRVPGVRGCAIYHWNGDSGRRWDAGHPVVVCRPHRGWPVVRAAACRTLRSSVGGAGPSMMGAAPHGQ
jgi:hypothetical protein